MGTGNLIKILVFGLAGFIVVVFVLSGAHFARAVYLNQLLQRERAERRLLALNALADDRGSIALVEIKEKDGFIILQPDGMESLALRVESEDERAYKKMAEKALAEHEAQKRLDALRHAAPCTARQHSSQLDSTSGTALQGCPANAQRSVSAPQTQPYVCPSCGLVQLPEPSRSMVARPIEPRSSQNASATASGSQIAESGVSEIDTPAILSGSELRPAPSSDSLDSADRAMQGDGEERSSASVNVNDSERVETNRRSSDTVLSSSQGDIESNGGTARSKTLHYLHSAKRWLTSTDSYFD